MIQRLTFSAPLCNFGDPSVGGPAAHYNKSTPCGKLLRAMGGDLWFEPRFPTGSNFFFSVKMAKRVPNDSLVGMQ